MILINPGPLKFLAPRALWRGNEANSIYLTFDDGPDPAYTPAVLQILKEKKTKGAFFLNGSKVIQHAQLVLDIHSDKHLIGNHGFSHQSLIFKSSNTIIKEITKTNHAITNVLGTCPTCFRPPYGQFDFRLQYYLKKMNMSMIMWSLLTLDFKIDSASELLKIVKQHLHPGAILVFHDGHRNSDIMLQALPDIIDYIHKEGYSTARLLHHSTRN